MPIIYQAAPGQDVWIKGSEIIKKWKSLMVIYGWLKLIINSLVILIPMLK